MGLEIFCFFLFLLVCLSIKIFLLTRKILVNIQIVILITKE